MPSKARASRAPAVELPAVRSAKGGGGDFLDLLRSAKYSDLTLRTSFAKPAADSGGGARAPGAPADAQLVTADFNLHKAVLAARCGPTFVSQLEANLDPGTGAFHVVGSTEAVDLLLLHLYTDATSLPADQPALVFEVMALVNALQEVGGAEVACLQRLKELAELRIATDLSRAPAGAALVQRAHDAAEHGAEQLLAFCLRQIDAHFDELHAQHVLRGLRTDLALRLFRGRSRSPLQDSLLHGRIDVATSLLAPAEADSDARPAAGPERQAAAAGEGEGGGSMDAARLSERQLQIKATLSECDREGRSALEVACLDLQDRAAMLLLLDAGHEISPQISAGRKDAEPGDSLLHVAVRRAGRLHSQALLGPSFGAKASGGGGGGSGRGKGGPGRSGSGSGSGSGLAGGGGLDGGLGGSPAFESLDADPSGDAMRAAFVDLLVQRGAPLDEANAAGLSALDVALWEGQQAAASLLLKAGARPLPTLLHRAVQSGAPAPAAAVPPRGREGPAGARGAGGAGGEEEASDGAPMRRGRRADAGGGGGGPKARPPALLMLLSPHAAALEVEARDEHGRTALLCAIDARDKQATNALLSRGADVRAADDAGRTALQRAIEHNDQGLVLALLSRGADALRIAPNGVPLIALAAQRPGRICFAMLEAFEREEHSSPNGAEPRSDGAGGDAGGGDGGAQGAAGGGDGGGGVENVEGAGAGARQSAREPGGGREGEDEEGGEAAGGAGALSAELRAVMLGEMLTAAVTAKNLDLAEALLAKNVQAQRIGATAYLQQLRAHKRRLDASAKAKRRAAAEGSGVAAAAARPGSRARGPGEGAGLRSQRASGKAANRIIAPPPPMGAAGAEPGGARPPALRLGGLRDAQPRQPRPRSPAADEAGDEGGEAGRGGAPLVSGRRAGTLEPLQPLQPLAAAQAGAPAADAAHEGAAPGGAEESGMLSSALASYLVHRHTAPLALPPRAHRSLPQLSNEDHIRLTRAPAPLPSVRGLCLRTAAHTKRGAVVSLVATAAASSTTRAIVMRALGARAEDAGGAASGGGAAAVRRRAAASAAFEGPALRTAAGGGVALANDLPLSHNMRPLAQIYELQAEALLDVAVRWRLQTKRAAAHAKGQRVRTAGAPRAFSGEVSAARSALSPAQLTAEAAHVLAELRLTLLLMIQLLRECQAVHYRQEEFVSSYSEPPDAPRKRQRAARAAKASEEAEKAQQLREHEAAVGSSAALAAATQPEGPDGTLLLSTYALRYVESAPSANVRPRDSPSLWPGFSYVLKVLSDFWRLPLPTATDPFTLRWFDDPPSHADESPRQLSASSGIWQHSGSQHGHSYSHSPPSPRARERASPPQPLRGRSASSALASGSGHSAKGPASPFHPAHSHSAAELEAMAAADVFISASLLGRRRRGLLDLQEQRLPQLLAAGTPSLDARGWALISACIYGSHDEFAFRKALSVAREDAASRLAMAYRRVGLERRVGDRVQTKLDGAARMVQYHWRMRAKAEAVISVMLERTGISKAEFAAKVKQERLQAEREKLALRRQHALRMALQSYPDYVRTVTLIQVWFRVRLARLRAHRLRAAKSEFTRKVILQGMALEVAAIKWQRNIRRWEERSDTVWSEYTRVTGAGQLTVPNSEGAHEQIRALRQSHQAALEELQAAKQRLAPSALADYYRLLATTSHGRGVERALSECLEVYGFVDQATAAARKREADERWRAELEEAEAEEQRELARVEAEARAAQAEAEARAAAARRGTRSARASQSVADGERLGQTEEPFPTLLPRAGADGSLSGAPLHAAGAHGGEGVGSATAGAADGADGAQPEHGRTANVPAVRTDQEGAPSGEKAARNGGRRESENGDEEEGSLYSALSPRPDAQRLLVDEADGSADEARSSELEPPPASAPASPAAFGGATPAQPAPLLALPGAATAGSGARTPTARTPRSTPRTPREAAQRVRALRARRPGEVERLRRGAVEELGHPIGWMERRLAALDEDEERAPKVPFGRRPSVVHLAVLQHTVDERNAAAARLRFLEGARTEAGRLHSSTDWAGQLLVGMGGQLQRTHSALQHDEASKPSIEQLVGMCTAVEEGRGARNVLWELLDEASRQWTPLAVLDRAHATRASWAHDIESFVPQLPAAQAQVAEHAALTERIEELNGRLAALRVLEHALGKLRWVEHQRERIYAAGRLAASLRLKRPFKQAQRRLAEIAGSQEMVRQLRERSVVPPTRVTLRCTHTLPGARRGAGKGPGRAALHAAFSAQLRIDLANYLDFEPERLVPADEGAPEREARALAEQEAGLGEQACLVTYRVLETTDERIGGPRELIGALASTLAASDFELAAVGEALGVEPSVLAVELESRDIPTVADVNVRRLLNEAIVPQKAELRAAEKAMEPVLAEQRRRARLATPHGARADAVERTPVASSRFALAGGSLLGSPAAGRREGRLSLKGAAAAATASKNANVRSRDVKLAYYRALGRDRILRELDKACPRGAEKTREARLWLPRALDAASARLAAELEAPKRLVERVAPSYAKRREIKRSLAKTHQRLQALARALPPYIRHSLTVRTQSPREQHGWVSRAQFLASKRLAVALARAAVASADAALAEVLGKEPGGPRSLWGAASQMASGARARGAEGGTRRPVRPDELRATAELLGLDLRAQPEAEGGGNDMWLLWVAVEALAAPVPVFWKKLEGEQARAARKKVREQAAASGDAAAQRLPSPPHDGGLPASARPVRAPGGMAGADEGEEEGVAYENELSGQISLEHPLLGAFREFVKSERRAKETPRKWSHYEGWVQFAKQDMSGCFYYNFADGTAADEVPSIDAPSVIRRKLQKDRETKLSDEAEQGPWWHGLLKHVASTLRKERAESRKQFELACKNKAIDELSVVSMRPCPVPDIFIAAGALEIDLPTQPEMAWVAEFLLSQHATLPAGWEEYDVIDGLSGQPTGTVKYRNQISGDEGLPHPFRIEVATLLHEVEARAKQLLESSLAEMDGEQRRETGYDNTDIDIIDGGGNSGHSRWRESLNTKAANRHSS